MWPDLELSSCCQNFLLLCIWEHYQKILFGIIIFFLVTHMFWWTWSIACSGLYFPWAVTLTWILLVSYSSEATVARETSRTITLSETKHLYLRTLSLGNVLLPVHSRPLGCLPSWHLMSKSSAISGLCICLVWLLLPVLRVAPSSAMHSSQSEGWSNLSHNPEN